jgi:hypothetical protein
MFKNNYKSSITSNSLRDYIKKSSIKSIKSINQLVENKNNKKEFKFIFDNNKINNTPFYLFDLITYISYTSLIGYYLYTK